MRLRPLLYLPFLVPLVFSGTLFAQIEVDLSVDVQFDGSVFEYRYTVENGAGSSAALALFGIENPTGIVSNPLDAPQNWFSDFSTNIDSIGWEALDQTVFISPGESAEFALTSINGPNFQEYVLVGSNLSTSLFEFANGQVLAPSPVPVPEPSSLFALLALVFPAVFRRRRESLTAG